jgi:nucleoside-triphosphatase THEP1
MPLLTAIKFQRGFDIDTQLAHICHRLTGNGLTIGGLIQENSCGDISGVQLVDIRSQEKFDIWENRGRQASGCRLDEAGLVGSAKVIEQAICDRVDLVIINRFGRAESEGKGLRDYFAQAVDASVPVLTGVREPYIEAWQQFHGGMAHELLASDKNMENWVASVLELSS